MLQLTSTIAAELRSSCCIVVNRSIRLLMQRVRNPHEPALVAALNQCTPLYTDRWRSILAKAHPDITLSTAAVFTHQTPRVTWTGKGGPPSTTSTCELADQLVAIIDRRKQTPERPAFGRAMLIQAKKASRGMACVTGKDLKQLQLLSERPSFSVTSPSNGPQNVNLSNLSPDAALFYGLIGPAFQRVCCDCCFPCKQWSLRDNLSEFANHNGNSVHIDASANFASVVVGMLQGLYGWEFKMPPQNRDWKHYGSNPRDDWSYLISYLLDETFRKSYSGGINTALGVTDGVRGNETSMFLMASSGMRVATSGIIRSLSERLNNQGPENQFEWQRYAPNGDGGDDGPPDIETELSEYAPGPISAIVFEIDNNYESDR
jgi:hypothetical protein